jgi:hypothetical protein
VNFETAFPALASLVEAVAPRCKLNALLPKGERNMYDTKPPMPAAMTPSDRLVVVGLIVSIVLLAASSFVYLV